MGYSISVKFKNNEEKEKMKAFVEQKTRRLKEKRKKLQLFLILNKRFW